MAKKRHTPADFTPALLALGLAFSANIAVACSCMGIGNFVEYAKQSASVIHARVVNLGPRLSHGEALHESMRVEVVAVVKGDFDRESVVLLGDPGFLCRDYVDSRVFFKGEEFLIALHGDEAEQPFGGCGEAWVTVNGDAIEGTEYTDRGREKYSMTLAEVLEKIRND